MISLRVWAERFPAQLRLLVALLSMLSFVAPTWHVCVMGGHVMEMSRPMTQMGEMNHYKSFPVSQSGSLICFCAAPHRSKKFPDTIKAAWNGRMTHDANCLALMLSAMPALLATAQTGLQTTALSFTIWFPTPREFPSREFIRTFSGRGPPR